MGEGQEARRSGGRQTFNGWLLGSLTVPLVLVDHADEEDGLLVHPHAVLVGAKQLLHVLFCDRRETKKSSVQRCAHSGDLWDRRATPRCNLWPRPRPRPSRRSRGSQSEAGCRRGCPGRAGCPSACSSSCAACSAEAGSEGGRAKRLNERKKIFKKSEAERRGRSTVSPSAVVVVAGPRQVEAAEAFGRFHGVAVGHRAQRELLLRPVVGTEPGARQSGESEHERFGCSSHTFTYACMYVCFSCLRWSNSPLLSPPPLQDIQFLCFQCLICACVAEGFFFQSHTPFSLPGT